ncbi:WD40 repeat domain-containing protein [Sphaerisporangium aureirubrum]|uniref:WD40 repeat domain-containing protein n=1 Tax=Sphaerisporangium aureirubrum TaxID=1544736 RepID=A0ABW1NNU1_9ACTN
MAIGWLDQRAVAVSVGQEGTIRVWSLPTLAPLGKPIVVHNSPAELKTMIFQGAELSIRENFDPVAKLYGGPVRVTAGDEIVLTDVRTGRRVRPRIYLGEDNGVNGVVVLNVRGRPTAVVNDDGGDENEPGPDPLRFFDLRTGAMAEGIGGDFATVRKVLTRRGVALLTLGHDPAEEDADPSTAGALTLWDPVTRRPVATMPGDLPKRDVGRSTFRRMSLATGNVDGHSYALTGGGDNVLRLWDLDTAKLVAETEPAGHTDWIDAIDTTDRNGTPLAVTGGYDGRAVVWDLNSRRRDGAPMTDPTGPIHLVTTGRLGGRPVVVTRGGELRIWDLDSHAQIGAPIPAAETAQVVTSGDRMLLLGEAGGRTRVVDLATRAEIGVPVKLNERQPGRYLMTDLDGRPALVVVGRTTRVSDLSTGRLLRRVRRVASDSTAFTAARLRCAPVILSGRGTSVHIWDARTGKEVAPPLTGLRKGALQILAGKVGDRPIAVTMAGDGTVRVWDLTRSVQLGGPIDTGPAYVRLALGRSGDRTVLLAGGNDERLRLWDLGPRAEPG